MKELFSDLLGLDDVHGVLFLTDKGKIVFQSFNVAPSKDIKPEDLSGLLKTLIDQNEVEIVYDNARLYIRKTATGYLVVVMGRFALMAMVRLNCDIITPALASATGKSRGLSRFFKK